VGAHYPVQRAFVNVQLPRHPFLLTRTWTGAGNFSNGAGGRFNNGVDGTFTIQTAGEIQAMAPPASAQIFYRSNTAVDLDLDGNGSIDDSRRTCLDPRLLMCLG